MAQNMFYIPNARASVVAVSYLAWAFTQPAPDTEVAPCADPAAYPAGFSKQGPLSVGQMLNLQTHGNVQARCDGGWTRDAPLACSDTADKAGWLKLAGAGQAICAYALQDAADGNVGNVRIIDPGQTV